MLQLRLSSGINFDDYAACTGYDARKLYRDQIDRLARLQLIDVDNCGFRLSRKGLDVADAIAAEFLLPHA
jgi:coproporphyrinogen III oxidase-like Fe-S oxidoreductase